MSDDIADRITREHKISSIGGNGKTEIAFCACGVRCENEDDGDDGLLAGYWRHIAFVTETAVRQQAAAEIEQQGAWRGEFLNRVRPCATVAAAPRRGASFPASSCSSSRPLSWKARW